MRYLSALAFALAASPAWAQQPAQNPATSGSPAVDHAGEEADDSLSQPIGKDEIVVIATKFGGQIDAPQAPIATFDETEIQALGAGSVGELLTRVSPQTGSGRERGGGGMPLVLVNGQRITNFR